MKLVLAYAALQTAISEAFVVAPGSGRRNAGFSCAGALSRPSPSAGPLTPWHCVPPLHTKLDGFDDALSSSLSSTLLLSDLLEIATNVAIGIVGVFALLAGLAFLSANWLIPQAAKQLEENCRKDFPELWVEYEAKLGAEETLAERPDLIQELGNIYNARFMRELERAQAAQRRDQGEETNTNEALTTGSTVGAIDAEIVDRVQDEQRED